MSKLAVGTKLRNTFGSTPAAQFKIGHTYSIVGYDKEGDYVVSCERNYAGEGVTYFFREDLLHFFEVVEEV